MTKLQCGNLVEFNSVSILCVLTSNTGSGSSSTYDMKKTTVVARANPRGHCCETCHRRGEVLCSGLWKKLFWSEGPGRFGKGSLPTLWKLKGLHSTEACSATETYTADLSAVETVFFHQIRPHGSSRHPEYASR